MKCVICTNHIEHSPDRMVVCEHKQGAVHYGCCTHRCSQNGKPCVHCKAIYDKAK